MTTADGATISTAAKVRHTYLCSAEKFAGLALHHLIGDNELVAKEKQRSRLYKYV